MSDDTHAQLDDAVTAHQAARSAAVAAGEDPEQVSRADAEAAALAHLADVDPGYHDREGAKAPADRQVVPDVKAAYDKALEALHADPGNAAKAAKASKLGDELEAARVAARVLEGRPLVTQMETPATPAVED